MLLEISPPPPPCPLQKMVALELTRPRGGRQALLSASADQLHKKENITVEAVTVYLISFGLVFVLTH